MSENTERIFKILIAPIVTAILFTILNFIILPGRAIADQVNENSGNIIRIEAQNKTTSEKLDSFINEYREDKKENKETLKEIMRYLSNKK